MSRHLDRINEQIINELEYLKTQRFEAKMFVIGFKPRLLTSLCVVVDRAAYPYQAFTLVSQRVRSSGNAFIVLTIISTWLAPGRYPVGRFSGPHVEHHMPTGEEWSVWPNDTLATPLQVKF